MDTRPLGTDGPLLSVVGLGCNNFGMRIDEEASRAVVHAALDEGITHFDTAEMYGGGKSEEFLAAALGARRDEVVIATKFLPRPGDEEYTPGALAARIRAGVEISLGRLATDRIDVYYQHYPDAAGPIEEALETLDVLVREGKVLHLASSNVTGAAHPTTRSRSPPTRAGPASAARRSSGTCSTARSKTTSFPPLASAASASSPTSRWHRGCSRGSTSGARSSPRDRASTRCRSSRHVATDENFDRVDALTEIAEERGHSLLELAVAWLAAQEGVTSVIAGATSAEQVPRQRARRRLAAHRRRSRRGGCGGVTR